MIAPGTTVSLTDTDGNCEDEYNLISATDNRTNTGLAVVDLELESRDANDITAATT